MGQRTILVVDDDPDIRDTIKELLHSDGLEAATAASGPEALQILTEGSVGVVLLDLMMPVMNGAQVVEEMRRREIDVPVILLSAGRDLGRVSEELDLPALKKPFELEDLLHQVRSSLIQDIKAPISG